MTHYLLTENQVQDLMNDEEGRKTLIRMFRAMNHRLLVVAMDKENLWGPIHGTLHECYKMALPHLERINEARREEKRKK